MRQAQQSMAAGPDQRAALEAVRMLDPLDPVAALVHLLTPADALLGAGVHLVRGAAGVRVLFRGRVVEFDDAPDLEQVARGVADVVAAAAPSAPALDLCRPRSSWLKPVRSGAWVVLGGSRELFGGPVVLIDPAVASEALVGAVCATLDSGSVPLPGATLPPFGVRVRGSSARVVLEGEPADDVAAGSVEGPGEVSLLLDAARSCAVLERELGAVSSRWLPTGSRFPGTVTVVGELELADGSRVEVPVLSGLQTVMAGLGPSHAAAGNDGVSGGMVPEGFRGVGLGLPGDGKIVEHGTNGVRAAVRRSPGRSGVSGSKEDQ